MTARAVAETLSQDDAAGRLRARDIAEWPTAVTPDQPLDQALVALETSAAVAVPVLDGDGRIVGWLAAEAMLPLLQGPPAPVAAK